MPKLNTPEGQEINPRAMLLTEQDTKMLLLDQNVIDDSVYYMDIEKGKIITQIKHENGLPINDISAFTKTSFKDTNSIFYGVQDNNLLVLDPRVEGGIGKERTYATDCEFNSIASSRNGWFATGSKTGEIRLYKGIGVIGGKNAKNLLPSLRGNPILHLDTSADGRYILATTKDEIFLIPTMQGGNNGFETTFFNSKKPRPLLLKISPRARSKHEIKEVNYRYAKFDEKDNGKESYIVAANGRFLIIWSMANVLRGRLTSNTIKDLGDMIIREEFKYNSNKLIAALPQQVVMQSTKKNKKLYK